MSIIMDEVYTWKACEFVKGQFRGIELGSDNPTKTTLSVMISSLTTNFSEIAAMVPLNKLVGQFHNGEAFYTCSSSAC